MSVQDPDPLKVLRREPATNHPSACERPIGTRPAATDETGAMVAGFCSARKLLTPAGLCCAYGQS